jgi:MauM/NapG family ferredoxin protein
VAGLFLFRATPQSRGSTSNPFLIRPPGSLPERDFLKRCTACGMCMKICPTGCLQPAWTEAGLEGLWTPRVAPRIGRCEYDCTLCGQVCPTGAIARLSTEEKHEIRLGIATIDHSRCIPYAYGRDCGTCVEACPISPKAIRLVDVEVQVHDGRRQRTKIVSQPMVDPDRCLGCGGCVKECTFKDEPAIHVTSANESRHPAIKPFLSASPSPANPPPAPDAPY